MAKTILQDGPVQWGRISERAAAGEARARALAIELEEALHVLSKFDEGADLVLYYKRLMALNGESDYRLHLNETDALTPSQEAFVDAQYELFRRWYASWPGRDA